MEFGKWLKRQIATIAFATSSVEKNMLSQGGDTIDIGVGQEQRRKQGTLSDALVRGELTQEVKDLRWRMYKVMRASENVRANFELIRDSNGEVVEARINEMAPSTTKLDDYKVDEYDSYPVLMVVDNGDIPLNTQDSMGFTDEVDEIVKGKDFEGYETATIGELDAKAYLSSIKTEKPINIERNFKPKFEIEKFCDKLVVRKISDTEMLLEFYISKYPKEDDAKTAFLLSEIKKAMVNPRVSDMLDFQTVSFITNKTIGAMDMLLFNYEINRFDKIIEFNGNYVIKFIANVVINGDDLMEQYREKELDKKYENKQRK